MFEEATRRVGLTVLGDGVALALPVGQEFVEFTVGDALHGLGGFGGADFGGGGETTAEVAANVGEDLQF